MSEPSLRDLDGADPYRLLGIDPSADDAEIIAAHRRLIREAHPDRSAGDDRRVKLLNIARDILLDVDLRAAYDRASVTEPGTAGERDSDDGPASAWADAEWVDSGGGAPASSAPPAARLAWPHWAQPGAGWVPPGGAQFWGDDQWHRGWAGAAQLLAYLLAGGRMVRLPGTPVMLRPGESAYGDAILECSHFSGAEVTYTQQSYPVFGSPAGVIGGMIGTAISNSRTRSQAEAMAAPQWRDAFLTRLVLTEQRILISVQGRWLSFHHSDFAQFSIDTENFTLYLSYHETSPLRLRAPCVLWIAVAMAARLYPLDQLRTAAALMPLLRSLPGPRQGPG